MSRTKQDRSRISSQKWEKTYVRRIAKDLLIKIGMNESKNKNQVFPTPLKLSKDNVKRVCKAVVKFVK